MKPNPIIIIYAFLAISWLNAKAQNCPTVACSPPINYTNINGPNRVAAGTFSYYSLDLGDNLQTTWSVPREYGAIINTTGNSVAIRWLKPGADIQIQAIPFNGCGGGLPITKTVTIINRLVEFSAPITGLTNVCTNSPTTYSVANSVGKTVVWNYGFKSNSNTNSSLAGFDLPTITINENTLTLTWKSRCSLPNDIDFYIYAAYHDIATNSSGFFTEKVIKFNPATPVISGNNLGCINSSSEYRVTNLVNGDIVTWSLPSGGGSMIPNGNRVNVQWASATGTFPIRASITNSCYANPSSFNDFNVELINSTSPQPDINGPEVSCIFSESTFTVTNLNYGSTINWTLSSGGSLVHNGSTATVRWGNTAGSYNVTASISHVCASTPKSTTKTIIVNHAPSTPGSIVMLPGIACANEVVAFSGASVPGAVAYEWEITSSFINMTSTTPSANFNYPFPMNGNYTISLRALNNLCKSQASTLPISIGSVPRITPSGPGSQCVGAVTTFTAPHYEGVAYNWAVDGGDVTGPSNTSTIDLKWANSGHKQITVTLAKTCPGSTCPGCPPTRIIPAFVNVQTPAINLDQILGPTPACIGTSDYTVSGTLNNISSINWTVPSTDGTARKIDFSRVEVNWTKAGASTLNATATNSCGSIITKSLGVTVNSGIKPATPTIIGATSSCPNQQKAYSVIQESGITYHWSALGGDLLGTANTANVTWNTSGSVSVIPSSSQCQGQAAFQPVTVSIPTPTISGTTTVCQNSTSTYSTQSGFSNYIWSVDGGSILSGQGTSSVSIRWVEAGAKAISVNYSNGSCLAPSPTLLPITVLAHPDVNINPSTSINCNNSALTVSVASNENQTYAWFYKTPTSTNFITTGVTTNTFTTYTTAAYDYQVRVTNNLTGCTATSATFSHYPTNPGTISGNSTICAGGDPVAFTQSGSYAPGTSFQWQSSFDNVTFTDIPSATATVYDPPAGITQTTYYKRISKLFTCSAESNKVIVTVNSVNPGAIRSNQQVCPGGDPAVLTESTQGTGSGTLSYQWQQSLDGTTFSNVANANSRTYDPPAGITQRTSYRRIVRSTLNSVACESTGNTVVISMKAVPAAPAVVSPVTYCQSVDAVPLTATGSNLLWYTALNGTGSATAPTPITTTAGTVDHFVSQTVNGCESPKATIRVVVNPKSDISITSPTAPLCIGSSLSLSATPTGGSWSGEGVTGNMFNSSTLEAGVYPVKYTFTNSFNCISEAIQNIDVIDRIRIINSASELNPSPFCRTASLNFTPTLSNGGSYSWTATSSGTVSQFPVSGSGPIVANISNNGSALSTVTYRITPTASHSCVEASNYVVRIQPMMLSVSITGPTSACSNASVSYVATDVPGSTYLWSTGATTRSISPRNSGTYTVTVTNSTYCNSPQSASKTLSLLAASAYITGSGNICTTGVTLTASTGSSYRWSTGATTRSILVRSNGTYSVTVSFSNGCSATASYSVGGTPIDPKARENARPIDPCATPVMRENEDELLVEEITAFPNPANHELQVILPQAAKANVPIKVIDSFNREVMVAAIAKDERKTTIYTKELAAGVYVIQLHMGIGMITKKVVINH